MLIFYVFALLAGIASAVEPGQNAEVAESLESPLVAGIVSLGVSILTILLVMIVTGQAALPEAGKLAQVPWWAWGGGVLSAVLALAQLTIPKRIGAAAFLGIIVTAGVVTSIGLDHFGLVGFTPHPAEAGRLVGGALMIAGVALVART
jgi:transporter family-2 protein